MATIINPHIALLIKGAEDWWSDDERTRLDMSINVTKDLDGEPNEAEVVIYNLNADTRNRIIDPSTRDTPIEIHFAPFGSDDLVKCFVGEIENARTTRDWPGLSTRLTCKSQRWHTRDKNVSGQTYGAGTRVQQIIDDLTAIIDLPVQAQAMPSGAILFGQTFNGPAFALLERFLLAYGAFCYICDGVLYISDVYDPPNPTLIEITDNMLVSEPSPTFRKDVGYITMGTLLDLQPAKKRTRRKKKKKPTWVKQALSQNDYANYDAVDEEIQGIELETLGTPAINPDNIVSWNDAEYRVQSVTHQGDTREGVTTLIRADVFDGDGTYGGAF